MDPLICDLYQGDLNGTPDVAKLISAGPPWHGLMLKATEGLYYPGTNITRQWFLKHWPLVANTHRYGSDWFRGAYHYLRIDQDPKRQADFYLQLIKDAGGWGNGDLWPVVDVENANNPSNATAQQIIDCTSKFAEEIKAATGKSTILYGGSYIADKGITSHMGCALLWTARYTSTLPATTYTNIGWDLHHLFAWQGVGDGVGAWHNYPLTSPIGKIDISALTISGGGQAALEYVRANMMHQKA